ETFRWTVVQQIDPGASAAAPPPSSKTRPKNPKSPNFSNFKSVIVLQKSYECSECGKSFSCSSHFSKHRRTHTG
ncbi:ZN267 protein, partial [Quiscalus mexicanus]|nr:ZN267 protein [Quiscalus mexicanus]